MCWVAFYILIDTAIILIKKARSMLINHHNFGSETYTKYDSKNLLSHDDMTIEACG